MKLTDKAFYQKIVASIEKEAISPDEQALALEMRSLIKQYEAGRVPEDQFRAQIGQMAQAQQRLQEVMDPNQTRLPPPGPKSGSMADLYDTIIKLSQNTEPVVLAPDRKEQLVATIRRLRTSGMSNEDIMLAMGGAAAVSRPGEIPSDRGEMDMGEQETLVELIYHTASHRISATVDTWDEVSDEWVKLSNVDVAADSSPEDVVDAVDASLGCDPTRESEYFQVLSDKKQADGKREIKYKWGIDKDAVILVTPDDERETWKPDPEMAETLKKYVGKKAQSDDEKDEPKMPPHGRWDTPPPESASEEEQKGFWGPGGRPKDFSDEESQQQQREVYPDAFDKQPEESVPADAPPPGPEKEVKPIDTIMGPEKNIEEKKLVVLSFLAWLQKLQIKWEDVSERNHESTNPGRKHGRLFDEYKLLRDKLGDPRERDNLSPETMEAMRKKMRELEEVLPEEFALIRQPTRADKMALLREMRKIQVQVSKAGNVYKQLTRVLGKDMPKGELITWLHDAVAGRTKVPYVEDDPKTPKPPKPEEPGVEKKEPRKKKAPPSKSLKDMTPEKQEEMHRLYEEEPEESKSEEPKPTEEKAEKEDEGDEPIEKESDAGNDPAGSSAHPWDGQRDTLSKEEISGTGKIKYTGQANPPAPGAPPAAPPVGQPPEGGPGSGEIGMDPGLVDEKMEDPRSLEELLVDINESVEALTEKVEAGETIMHGQELEPISTDSGALPGPAPHIAVDEDAKDYYKHYFGEYGDLLTMDRVADIVDLVEKTAAHYKVAVTDEQIENVANFVAGSFDGDSPAYIALASNQDSVAVADDILVDWVIRTGTFKSDMDVDMRPLMFKLAFNTLPTKVKQKVATYVRLADKMKQPKINDGLDDAVDLDEMDDKADEDDNMLARPAHLLMCVEDKHLDGAYLKLEISWDPDHEAAERTGDGMKHAVLSFVKGLESKKEFLDYGFLGQISFDEFDADAGVATVSVRTKKPGDAPLSTKEVKKAQMGNQPGDPSAGDEFQRSMLRMQKDNPNSVVACPKCGLLVPTDFSGNGLVCGRCDPSLVPQPDYESE